MRLGSIELRLPWTRYVDMPIEEELYWAVRKSIGADIADVFEDAHCNCTDHKSECDIYNKTLNWAAKIARGIDD